MTKRKKDNMKNKIVVAVIASMLIAGLAGPVSATPQKTLVIIDSGVNSQLDWVKNALVDEACFIEFGKCPNGQQSMTGPGAATLAATDAAKDKTFSHGTQMASVAVAVNPEVKIAAVRVVGMSDKGFANTYRTNSLAPALDWVIANAARLNVGAVSISLGRSYSEATCPVEAPLQSQIIALKQNNIGVFIAAGNGSNPTKVDYPACIPEVIAVGATDTRYSLRGVTGWIYPVMRISNGGADLDLYALGKYTTIGLDGKPVVAIGTSAATAAVASKWTQAIGQGGTYDSVWTSFTAELGNAYRSLTDVVAKQFIIS
jgi:hypothetical protein